MIQKATHILINIYFPAMIFYMLFAGEHAIWDKMYFLLEKSLICVLLFSYIDTEIRKSRKNIALNLSILQIIFVLYIIVDWNEAFVMDRVVLFGASFLYILALLINLLISFRHDRKRKG